MSKRLQIVVEDEEHERFRKAAAREGLSLSEWVRRALERARQTQKGPAPSRKLSALDRALECGYPTADIDEMLEEIEKGRDLR